MSLLAASLLNMAVVRFQSEDFSGALLQVWAARRLGGEQAAASVIAIARSQLIDRIESAQQSGDIELALRLDGLNAIFDPESRLRIERGVAVRRAAARCLDAERALLREELETAAGFALAALALDPDNGVASGYLNKVAHRLVARYRSHDQGAPTLEGTLALSLAVALGADPQREDLLKLLYDLGDFASVMFLCQGIEAEAGVAFEKRFAALQLRLRANCRLNGSDQAAAEAQAASDAREWLRAMGPPADLEDAAIRTRVSSCFNDAGYRQTLADLRELRRRTPEDPWVAHCFCVILHNALHPDVAASVELVARHCPDTSADLQARYTLLSTIGANAQAEALADRLTRHHREYAVIGALREMAMDLDAEPAFIFGRARTGRRLLYANLVCWGERYIDLMERGAVPSLLARNNIPALAAKADVVVELFTMPENARRLRDSPMLERLARFCEIRIHCFPDVAVEASRHFGYTTFGHALHATALRAERDGADITFLMPDLIYADGGYGVVADRLTESPLALFQDGLNAYSAPMLEQMQPFRRDDVLSVSFQDLIDAAMCCLSKRTLHSLYAPGDKQTCMQPTRIIFPIAGGLRTHAFMLMPVYVSHAALAPVIMKNFGTQDGVMTEHILNAVDESQMEVLSSEDFCYVEICEDDGLLRPVVEQGLATAIRDFFARCSLGRNRLRLFNRPISIPTLSPPTFPLVSVEEADARVREVQEMFATDPIMVDLAEEQEAVRRAFYR